MSDDPVSQADAAPDVAAQDLRGMERIKKGDAEALREFVENHQHRVIGTIAKMLGDEGEAEDIAQQVFVRVWKSAPRYEPTAKFTTWLFKITRNLVLNELRRRKRHLTRSLDEAEDEDHQAIQIADAGVKAPDTTMLDDEMQA